MDLGRIIPIFVLAALSFFVGMLWAPVLSRYLYRSKFWKKKVRTEGPDGSKITIFSKLHKDKEVGTPRMAGVLIWVTTFVFALGFFFLSEFVDHPFIEHLNFLSRSQTWIPLFTLVSASILGIADDLIVVGGFGRVEQGGGIRFRHRLAVVGVIALVGAWWFYVKLGSNSIHIPFVGAWAIHFWYIPLFVIVMFASFSS